MSGGCSSSSSPTRASGSRGRRAHLGALELGERAQYSSRAALRGRAQAAQERQGVATCRFRRGWRRGFSPTAATLTGAIARCSPPGRHALTPNWRQTLKPARERSVCLGHVPHLPPHLRQPPVRGGTQREAGGEWLGHADPAFTLRRYVHLIDAGVGDADFLDDAVSADPRRAAARPCAEARFALSVRRQSPAPGLHRVA